MGALLSLVYIGLLVGRAVASLGRRLEDTPTAPQHVNHATHTRRVTTTTNNGSAVQSRLGCLLRLLPRAQHKRPLPPTCLICLYPVPASASPSSVRDAITLACGHFFCRDCLGPYVATKVRERQVENDQLVCPAVECKRALSDCDLRILLPADTFAQFTRTRQRVRDEKNPLARWCPRADCSGLTLCAPGAKVFTCAKCATVGCFHCRGKAHRLPFSFRCRARAKATHSDDKAYLKWERSVGDGDGRAVRPCPQCQMRIWKSGGCNHMTCTHCHHEYCWVCAADWHRRHATCHDSERVNATPPAGTSDGAVGQAFVGLVLGLAVVGVVAIASAATTRRRRPRPALHCNTGT